MTEQEYEAFKEFINKVLYEQMTEDDYYIVMRRLGVNHRGNRFQSCCHHSNPNDGGYNLAFNPNSKSFMCFSQCSCSYSLLSLVKKHKELTDGKCSTWSAMKFICDQVNIPFNFKEEVKQVNTNIYKWQNSLLKYTKNYRQKIELKEIDQSILNYFDSYYHTEWIDYGISKQTLDKYQIKWYNYFNQIVIPCRQEDGKLIGIRVRNMNPNIDIKYKPLELLDGTEFNFPTNEVFYGENFNRANIERTRSVILVESEKTVMKFEDWYGEENNICLGLYGSVLSNSKLRKLLSWGCNTFYIALDSDFKEITYSNDKNKLTEYEKFEKKVMKIYNKLKPYGKVYVIYNNLGFKDCYKFSITDYEKEQFEQLWKKKEEIM